MSLSLTVSIWSPSIRRICVTTSSGTNVGTGTSFYKQHLAVRFIKDSVKGVVAVAWGSSRRCDVDSAAWFNGECYSLASSPG